MRIPSIYETYGILDPDTGTIETETKLNPHLVVRPSEKGFSLVEVSQEEELCYRLPTSDTSPLNFET